MDNIKLELSPPYKREPDELGAIAKISLSADFHSQYEALKFFADLQALVLRYQPEHEA